MAAVKLAPQDPNKQSRKDFLLLKLHSLFDEIEGIMIAKAYRTEQANKAVQLLKCARWFVIKAFGASYAE